MKKDQQPKPLKQSDTLAEDFPLTQLAEYAARIRSENETPSECVAKTLRIWYLCRDKIGFLNAKLLERDLEMRRRNFEPVERDRSIDETIKIKVPYPGGYNNAWELFPVVLSLVANGVAEEEAVEYAYELSAEADNAIHQVWPDGLSRPAKFPAKLTELRKVARYKDSRTAKKWFSEFLASIGKSELESTWKSRGVTEYEWIRYGSEWKEWSSETKSANKAAAGLKGAQTRWGDNSEK